MGVGHSLISLTVVSSNNKDGPAMVFLYLDCCAMASSVGRGDVASGELHGWLEIETTRELLQYSTVK